MPVKFMHRDQFRRQFPDRSDGLPALFMDDDGQLVELLNKRQLSQPKSLVELIELVKNKLVKLDS